MEPILIILIILSAGLSVGFGICHVGLTATGLVHLPIHIKILFRTESFAPWRGTYRPDAIGKAILMPTKAVMTWLTKETDRGKNVRPALI